MHAVISSLGKVQSVNVVVDIPATTPWSLVQDKRLTECHRWPTISLKGGVRWSVGGARKLKFLPEHIFYDESHREYTSHHEEESLVACNLDVEACGSEVMLDALEAEVLSRERHRVRASQYFSGSSGRGRDTKRSPRWR